MKEKIRRFLVKLPYLRSLRRKFKIFKSQNPSCYYYSPIVFIKDIIGREKEIFTIKSKEINGVELNENFQLQLLTELSCIYSSVPFKDHKIDDLRYSYNNTYYCYSDAIFLNLIIRYFKPKTIIEIGSGFSSAVILDTNELFFNNNINLTFIDPYPERLFSILKDADKDKHKIIIKELQSIDIEIFDNLEENDILFVDSTHVSKTGSDVNKIIFEILPRLKKNVLVHFHDIFYPFEYPKDWVVNRNSFGWNEDYILKAFLMYNTQFRITLFNTFLEFYHKDWFLRYMPDCLKNEGGSIWVQKQ